MTEKVLCVDDDPMVLSSFQRNLRKHIPIEVALGGAEGLAAIEKAGPYAVVVSDLRMPGMTGIEFLSVVKNLSPDTVRIMLTGNADTRTAIDAVNEGHIFRFLTKPCPPEDLEQALREGIDRYRMASAERELMQNTLNGSIRVLTEILSVVDPQSFGRADELRNAIRALAAMLKVSDSWEFELAAMLARIGQVTIPPEIVVKEKSGEALSPLEKEIMARIPETGHRLLAHIPRLEPVARIVLYQDKRFDGTGFPLDSVAGEHIPLGARLLKVVADLATVEAESRSRADSLQVLSERRGWYDPRVLDAAFLCFASSPRRRTPQGVIRSVGMKDLQVGQILKSDVITSSGALLIIKAGNLVSEALLARIRNFAKLRGIQEPIQVEMMGEPHPVKEVESRG